MTSSKSSFCTSNFKMKTCQRNYLCKLCNISNKFHTSSQLKYSKVGKKLVCISPGVKNQIDSTNNFVGMAWASGK